MISDRAARWQRNTFVVARMATGGYWLFEQHWKLPPDFGRHAPRGLMFAFEQSIAHPGIPLYAELLARIVVPHFAVFGWLLFLVELAIGLSLVFGVRVRVGAMLGTLQAANLLLAMGRTPEGAGIYVALLVANLAVLLGAMLPSVARNDLVR